jgi:hypothetical protein
MPTEEQEPTEYASTDEDNPDDAGSLPPGPYRVQLVADPELISKLVNDSTKKTTTEDPLEPDDVVDEFEDVVGDEQILKHIPQSMRGKPFTRQVYAFYSKANAQAMHRRLEQNITLIHQAMDEAEERIGSVSWDTADNNRSDPLNLAICIPVQIKNRAGLTMTSPPQGESSSISMISNSADLSSTEYPSSSSLSHDAVL